MGKPICPAFPGKDLGEKWLGTTADGYLIYEHSGVYLVDILNHKIDWKYLEATREFILRCEGLLFAEEKEMHDFIKRYLSQKSS